MPSFSARLVRHDLLDVDLVQEVEELFPGADLAYGPRAIPARSLHSAFSTLSRKSSTAARAYVVRENFVPNCRQWVVPWVHIVLSGAGVASFRPPRHSRSIPAFALAIRSVSKKTGSAGLVSRPRSS